MVPISVGRGFMALVVGGLVVGSPITMQHMKQSDVPWVPSVL